MMSLPLLFRMMYWSIRKDWRVCPHLMAVLAGWLTNTVLVRARGFVGRGTVVIGMVEHLGDIVAAEPVSRFARVRHYGSKVVWVVRKPYASLPAKFPGVDAVVTITCLTEWLLLRATGLGDPTWDLHINGRYCPRCQIPVLKTGPAATIDTENYHRSGNLLAMYCLSAGLPELNDAPELPIDADACNDIDRLSLPARFVAIHCVSNQQVKDWPRSNWAQLVQSIQSEFGIAVVEIGLAPLAITHDDELGRNLCGQLTINQTAEVIRRSALFIGIDSGPAHLANAVGAPGVILIGRYRGYDAFMPFSGRYENAECADIIRGDGPMDTLAVAPVLAAVRRRLVRS